ncbi:MAG: 4,5-DOPA dioxygenase extradiol [Flavobacteriales bacterium]
MKRKDFVKLLTLIPVAGVAMKLTDLEAMAAPMATTPLMPVIFFGHGSPMNAIEQNEFTLKWQELAKNIPRPNAILCISAHWETPGTFVTAMDKPQTIHDFGGFPQALFDVQYPAPGSSSLVADTKEVLKPVLIGDDLQWGLDHGCWSVLKHLYPAADVPVVQLSLDYRKNEQYHYDLAKQLFELRKKGFLIVGSGNMVHNLGMLNWGNMNSAYDWAIEANEKFKTIIQTKDHQALMNYKSLGTAFKNSIPTPEHFWPLLYILALQDKKEEAQFFNDKTLMGSISMTGVMFKS